MRLTDLLRGKEGKKKPVTSPLSKAVESSSKSETSKSTPKKVEQKSIHLQAEDLAALYDIDTPAEDYLTPASSGNDLAEPPRTTDKSETSGDDLAEEVSAEGVSAGEVGEGASENKEKAEKEESVVQHIRSARKPGDADDVKYDSKEDFEIADAIHIELLDVIDDIYDEGKNEKEISVERLIAPVTRLIEVCKMSNTILRKAVRLKKGGRSFTTHSLNLAILAIKIGLIEEWIEIEIILLML